MTYLQPVALPLRTSLFDIAEPPRYVHFLTSGLASQVTVTALGEAVEIGITGRDGFPEALHLLGPQTGDTRCFVQMEGTALRMDFARFQQEFQQNERLRNLVLRYTKP